MKGRSQCPYETRTRKGGIPGVASADGSEGSDGAAGGADLGVGGDADLEEGSEGLGFLTLTFVAVVAYEFKFSI